MIKGGINSPITSSCGRLFDAVSSMLGIRDVITFEGEAAIEMEMLTSEDTTGIYRFEIEESNPCIVNLRQMIMDIVDDSNRRVSKKEIAGRFHNTLVEIIVELSRKAREETSIKKVVLSGGCFQNRLLLKMSLSRLEQEGFDVFTSHIIPLNDGGISLGQAVVASCQIS